MYNSKEKSVITQQVEEMPKRSNYISLASEAVNLVREATNDMNMCLYKSQKIDGLTFKALRNDNGEIVLRTAFKNYKGEVVRKLPGYINIGESLTALSNSPLHDPMLDMLSGFLTNERALYFDFKGLCPLDETVLNLKFMGFKGVSTSNLCTIGKALNVSMRNIANSEDGQNEISELDDTIMSAMGTFAKTAKREIGSLDGWQKQTQMYDFNS